MIKVAGVVVLYNPSNSILKNIDSYICDIDKLYVIDNSDNDKKQKFNNSKIEYIYNGKNLGIAKALNIGALKAIDEGYKWLLTMDQDSFFEKDGLKNMKEFLEEIKNNKIVKKILNVDINKIGILSPFHLTKKDALNDCNGFDKPLIVMTSGNLINLDAYKKIKGFKDWLFIDCVDFDYCLNLKNNGFDILRLKSVVLNHPLGDIVYKNILIKKIYSLNHSHIRKYYMIRNRHYIADMYMSVFPDYCKLELKASKREAIKILLCEKNKFKKIKYMIKGYFDYKKGKVGAIDDEVYFKN